MIVYFVIFTTSQCGPTLYVVGDIMQDYLDAALECIRRNLTVSGMMSPNLTLADSILDQISNEIKKNDEFNELMVYRVNYVKIIVLMIFLAFVLYFKLKYIRKLYRKKNNKKIASKTVDARADDDNTHHNTEQHQHTIQIVNHPMILKRENVTLSASLPHIHLLNNKHYKN